ncbi:copper chaperone CopZ [Sporosarcina obsidiansis]|uniref:copper chaperone CopZ n=1 Tax=Sporosarcina obsidiansis TaxID=2660748 RepID=UPI00129BFDB4|nr:copper chaperone CopZ [Sporosarcina obsidiansis]
MKETTLNVQGMSCNHCVQAVEGAVNALPGVERALVELKANNVTVQFDEQAISIEQITEAIEEQGYDVKA